MTDRLRLLWDFDDLDATDGRLREQLAVEVSDEGRAEVLTQLARIEGLRGEFDAGERLIEEAESLAGGSSAARARIELERGRLRRSSGSPEAALSLFESAFATALEAGEHFVAVDAAHMAALAAPDRHGFVMWTRRGIDLAETHQAAEYWLGPLLNNLGWELYEAGEYSAALDAFVRTVDAREKEPENRAAIEIAHHAVGKSLRALGRSVQAIPLLEQAVEWAESEGARDGWFHEELAEEYAAVGREIDAREQARLALPLLVGADPSFAEDTDRAGRLRQLAGMTSDREAAEAELHCALIVAIPEATPAVDDWRERTNYAKPSSGVPPHVTILSPFVPPGSIDDSLIDDLRTLFEAFESFTFELPATGRFPTVLYLAPDPAEPFVRMTEAVCKAYPDYPPYGGAFDSIVPHLAAAEGDDETLIEAEANILPTLPINAEAREVLLIEEVEPNSARWRTRARLPLGLKTQRSLSS